MIQKNKNGAIQTMASVGGILFLAAVSQIGHAKVNLGGEISFQQRFFTEDAAYMNQTNGQASIAVAPQIQSWLGDSVDFSFTPFVRLDQRDSERTHFDVREAIIRSYFEHFEIRAGIGKVFWGQTESVHLVDIINQTDFVESIDGEDKLGQPLVDFRYLLETGFISIYVLPYFRERTFPGEDGRLRGPLLIDTDNTLYESEDEEGNVDYAVRWQQSIGSLELGLSYFNGTDRLPEFVPAPPIHSSPLPSLRPFYGQLEQIGLDALYVAGGWLLKLEALHGERMGEDFSAAVAGFEYTLVDFRGTGGDLGLLMEYQYDERDTNPYIFGQNDLMVGLRYSFNDFAGSEMLFGFVQDLDESSSYSAALEVSTRLSPNWVMSINGYLFASDSELDPLFFIEKDDHLNLEFSYFF